MLKSLPGEDIMMEHGDLSALFLAAKIRQNKPVVALTLIGRAIINLLLLHQSWSVSINEIGPKIEVKYSSQNGQAIIASYVFDGYEFGLLQQAILSLFKITEQSLNNGKGQGVVSSQRKMHIFVISLGSKSGRGISIFPKTCLFSVKL